MLRSQRIRIEVQFHFAGQDDFRDAADDATEVALVREVTNIGHSTCNKDIP